MTYIKNFSGKTLLKIDNDCIREFSGVIKYKIDVLYA